MPDVEHGCDFETKTDTRKLVVMSELHNIRCILEETDCYIGLDINLPIVYTQDPNMVIDGARPSTGNALIIR